MGSSTARGSDEQVSLSRRRDASTRLASPSTRSRVRVALCSALTLIAIALVATLSRSPPVVAATNSVAAEESVATTNGSSVFCQGDESLPSGTSAIRLWVNTNISPSVQVTVTSASRLLTRGEQQPGRLTAAIAIPVARLARAVADANVCFKFGPAVETVQLIGGKVPHRRRGEAPFKIRVEYLRAGQQTWLALAPSIARRIGLGRAPSGSWVALLPVVLMAIATLLAARLVLRQLGGVPAGCPQPAAAGAIPAAAWTCAVVACLSAASWSILTPPFQVADEPSHFAYVQQLAQAGSLPTSSEASFSQAEEVALSDLHHLEVRFNPAVGTIATAGQQHLLERDLALPLARLGPGGAGVAAPEPPLYYAFETVPYLLASGGTLLDQLALMRLFSVSMAGFTALFAFLFLRECLPRVRWAWTVGALATALAPLVGFMAGAVNPDSMLCAVSAALFYCLARSFRRGLTRRNAIWVGVVLTIGLLTKLNFLGLVPGTGVAVIVLARRASRRSRRVACQSLALALAIPACPVCAYLAINLLSNHPGFGLLSGGLDQTGRQGSLTGEISYIWQFYLPRLPEMARDFPGVSTARQIWFDRLVGSYGWLDTYFPNAVYDAALVPAGAIVVLCARSLCASRRALTARAGELLCYALIGAGVLALLGADAYLSFPRSGGGYAEPRYLLPLAPVFAAALALAARGAGRRWGPPTGALIVSLVLAHDIFSQLLVVGRYYG
jgi:Predicted membrane protein (DUF2142)